MKLDLLLDIEGTTSSIHFVHEVLFPYAKTHLESFVRRYPQLVGAELERARASLAQRGWAHQTEQDVVAGLLRYIDEDVKDTALKNLQGLIWERGYKEGAYQAHLYPDVADNLRKWKRRGAEISIYSSGSVHAQKLFFGHSVEGDVLSLFSHHFDTTTGPKRESESYTKIAQHLQKEPGSILFLSDVVAELDAAQAAGFVTGHVVRPGTSPTSGAHRAFADFDQVEATFWVSEQ